MSDDRDMLGALNSFTGSVNGSASTHPETAEEALLLEMDEYFSLAKNTELIRRFIEDNDDALTLVATNGADDTNSAGGLKLYALFQKYAQLMDGIIEEFVASRDQKEAHVLSSLVTAIQKEWNSSENAYRLLCTSYIAASLEYKSFLEFAEDLYGTMHYSVIGDDGMDEAENSNPSGSTYGFEETDNGEKKSVE